LVEKVVSQLKRNKAESLDGLTAKHILHSHPAALSVITRLIYTNMTCMYTNMRSIMNEYKRDEISEIMGRKGLDISGNTESWAHEGISNAELEIQGYNLFRKDRCRGVKTKRGGVLLYVKISILGLQEDSAEESEALWVKLLGVGI